MKKIFAAMTAALLMVALVSSVALAANPGNGSATKFTALYDFPTGTTWTCTGTHVANKNVIKDNETCVISGDVSGFVAGTYTGNYPITGYTASGWNSDFPGTLNTAATSWTITETDNGNGTFTLGIAAIY
jgi:hypothetical protein